MSRTSDDIKRYYGFKGLSYIENENVDLRKGPATQFIIEQKIWLDINLSEYRLVIPENMNFFPEEKADRFSSDLEMRYLTYKPTGKIIYDNSLPHTEAVIWEYKLFHSRDLVSGVEAKP